MRTQRLMAMLVTELRRHAIQSYGHGTRISKCSLCRR